MYAGLHRAGVPGRSFLRVQVHLLPDFVEFHNVQHLEADAVDE